MSIAGNIKIWIGLVLLTVLAAILSKTLLHTNYMVEIVLGISMLKFLGVSFYFMELKKAHVFWKGTTILFAIIFTIITLIII